MKPFIPAGWVKPEKVDATAIATAVKQVMDRPPLDGGERARIIADWNSARSANAGVDLQAQDAPLEVPDRARDQDGEHFGVARLPDRVHELVRDREFGRVVGLGVGWIRRQLKLLTLHGLLPVMKLARTLPCEWLQRKAGHRHRFPGVGAFSRVRVYVEPRDGRSHDWYIGYLRDGTRRYLCVSPTVVVRWERSAPQDR